MNQKISDGSVLCLIRAILEAGVVHPNTSELEPSELGTPQGGPLSPLLANIYLDHLDQQMKDYGLVRYADDFIIFARSQSEAEEALARARKVLEDDLKLQLHPEKTRIVTVESGFEFLGFHYFRSSRKVKDHPWIRYYKIPRRKSMQKFRDAVRALTPRIKNQRKPKAHLFSLRRLQKNPWLATMISELNRYLRSWYGYFRTGWYHAKEPLHDLDSIVRRRLRQALTGRLGNGWWNKILLSAWFHEGLGLLSLKQLHLDAWRTHSPLVGRQA